MRVWSVAMVLLAGCTSEVVDFNEMAVGDAECDGECTDTSVSATICTGQLMCLCPSPTLGVTGPHPPEYACPPGCAPWVVGTGEEACLFAEAVVQPLQPPLCPSRSDDPFDVCMDNGVSVVRGLPLNGCCTVSKVRSCGPYTVRDMIGFQLRNLGLY